MCQKYASKMETGFARTARAAKQSQESKDYDLLLKGEVEAGESYFGGKRK